MPFSFFRPVCLWGLLLLLLASCQSSQSPTPSTSQTVLPTAKPTDTVTPSPSATLTIPFPTPEPLPAYLNHVFPSTVDQIELSSEEYFQRLRQYDRSLDQPSICVGVYSYHLLERGDRPSTREFIRQMNLIVDGEILSQPNAITAPDMLGSAIYDEAGEFLFRTPDGVDFNVCWPADLQHNDSYTATFQFTKTSGEVEA